MPWFKVDDNLAFHAKAVAAGNPAIGLWTRAGSWCAQQLTDGFVPDHMLAALGTKGQAARLVEVGLWDRVEGGHSFHEWHDRQPSRADVEADRAAAKERMRAAREAKRIAAQGAKPQVNGSRAESVRANKPRSSGEVQEVFAQPDPTRPDPTRPTTSTDVDVSPAVAGSSDFESFWDAYGKKIGKGAAIKAWAKALKKTDAETLIEAARQHTAWHQRATTEPRFIPHPSTWLNECRWLDERPAATSPASKPSTTDARVMDGMTLAARLAHEERNGQQTPRAIGQNR